MAELDEVQSTVIWPKMDYKNARGLYDRRVSVHAQLQHLVTAATMSRRTRTWH